MTRIVIVGAKGRMGQAIARLLETDSEAKVVGQIDVGDNLESVLSATDAVIDFSHHSTGLQIAKTVAAAGKVLVVGTTGHGNADRDGILEAGKKVPMIFAPNYSVGVNVLFHLTRVAAEILGEDFDQEVIEMHHRLKKDAPSGTARRLVEILADVKKTSYEKAARHGRVGEPGARTPSEIGVHAVRGGDVVGDHTVLFAALGERVELVHKASSRDTFAAGAIRAAKWLQGKPAGVYEMADVLGLR